MLHDGLLWKGAMFSRFRFLNLQTLSFRVYLPRTQKGQNTSFLTSLCQSKVYSG